MELDTSTIVWPFVTAILFGLYLAGFAHCVRWLLFEDDGWKVRKKINWTLMTATSFIFFFTTAWFSMALMQVVSPDPIYLPSASHIPANILVELIFHFDASYWFIPIIINYILIYRCWIVSSKNWFIICFPLALWCSSWVCAIMISYCIFAMVGAIVLQSNVGLEMCLQYSDMFALGFYVCNIVISIYTTCALVYRIWRAAKNNSAGTSHLYRICRILTESGILYTLSSVLNLAWWTGFQVLDSQTKPTEFWAQLHKDIPLPVGVFIPAIAFNLITIRVSEQRAMGQDTWVDGDTNEAPIPSELLNNPATEMELTNLGQERRENIDEGNLINIRGTENEDIVEVVRTTERQV